MKRIGIASIAFVLLAAFASQALARGQEATKTIPLPAP
jgi:hypothetical protein